MTDRFLTKEEITEFTGYTQAKRQRRELAKQGIWFAQDRNGNPKTTWFHINNPLSLRLNNIPDSELTAPNFDAM
ncbi:TPA: DUF4224 domain-containing protein [Escherichia coli]|nr:DUF4224 domain-containing protein [Escherichia coli]HAJ7164761.1 DUF4224 domain-containing protein [Escherichia coli]HAJ7170016.1 DUF4224 domain-containing protein [Escherichia coli]HAJ7199202.1 DUF4224 domain-containing protein [Escherichia coli]